MRKRPRRPGAEPRQPKLWAGRFEEGTDREVERFTESISVDRRLFREDIRGSLAHCEMLARQGILSKKDAARILKGLKEIEKEIETGVFPFSSAREDIHMHVEARLIEKIGETGGRLHTGRSRNDQVALDVRLHLLGVIRSVRSELLRLRRLIVERARRCVDVILPGFTHLQKAQPVRLAHHLMAYYQMFSRDDERFRQLRERVAVMPLGAGALAGSGYPVNPRFVADRLGFSRVAANSMDAVSDRDFAVEFVLCASLVMLHLSRWCEELILWTTDAFGFAELPDGLCTGSSMMPQKRNPDVLELIRAKTGRVYGDLVTLLTLLKALPLTYNRDMQEDKPPLFDAADTVRSCLSIFCLVLEGVRFREDRMRSEAQQGFLNATDLADELVRRGFPFRKAHRTAGEAVRYCADRGKALEDLGPEEWQRLCPGVDPSIREALGLECVVERRDGPGGTSRRRILEQIRSARHELSRDGAALEAEAGSPSRKP